MEHYSVKSLNVSIFKNYINHDSSKILMDRILNNIHIHPLTKKGEYYQKRSCTLYGDTKKIKTYTTNYYSKEYKDEINSWENIPELLIIKDSLENLTNQEYHMCSIHFYPNGNVGINPHKDKEIKPDKIIASISLGSTRIMTFNRLNENPVNFGLENGTLCLINPPTNYYWTHSISKNPYITNPRISIVFRNCEGLEGFSS